MRSYEVVIDFESFARGRDGPSEVNHQNRSRPRATRDSLTLAGEGPRIAGSDFGRGDKGYCG